MNENELKTAQDLMRRLSEEQAAENQANEFMRQRSGSVNSTESLVSFLYELIRDHVTPGDIEKIMRNSEGHVDTEFTNGWLADYAKDVANRLR